jgi:hypothetical protein
VSGHNPLVGNTIITGAGNSQIIGGSGNNTIEVGVGDSVVIAADGEIDYDSSGRPVAAKSLYPTFGGTDRITVAPGGSVFAGQRSGARGVVVESPGANILSLPKGYLVVPNGGSAEHVASRGGWINPKAPKTKPKPTHKHKPKPTHKHKPKPTHKPKPKPTHKPKPKPTHKPKPSGAA